MKPTFFAAIVCLAGLLASRSRAIYWQMAFCLFGAAAAIELPALGGAVISPSVLFLPFLALRAWSEQHGRNRAVRMPMAGVWLTLAVLIGLVGAFFLPRFFAGDIRILTVDRSTGNLAVALYALRPVSGNITQSGYAVGAVIAFFSMRALLQKPTRLEHFRDAVLWLAGLDCAAAIINLAEFHLGLPKILDFVRTAYSVFDSYEAAGTGMMRIHGTFSETSGFCAFSLPLFAFTFSLWLNNVRALLSGTLAFLLLTFLGISTSSTAYVGLVVYATALAFVLAYRGYIRGTVPRFGLLVAGTLLAIVAAGSPFVLDTEIGRRIQNYFEITVFDKLESASGIERSSWNTQAWSNFVDTFGLGVGLGSARASSLLLVLLSNLGLLGSLCYLGFLRRLFPRTAGWVEIEPVSEASRQAVLATLSAALVSCAIFDLGIAFYAYAAAASIAPTLGRRTYMSGAAA